MVVRHKGVKNRKEREGGRQTGREGMRERGRERGGD